MLDVATAGPAELSGAGLIDELIRITERLLVVVEEETALLTDLKLDLIGAIGPEKSRLAARYDMLMRMLMTRPIGEINGTPGWHQLADGLKRLHAATRLNAGALELQMKANGRVLDIIKRAATTAARPDFTYGTTRLGHGHRTKYDAPPVAVNRVF